MVFLDIQNMTQKETFGVTAGCYLMFSIYSDGGPVSFFTLTHIGNRKIYPVAIMQLDEDQGDTPAGITYSTSETGSIVETNDSNLVITNNRDAATNINVRCARTDGGYTIVFTDKSTRVELICDTKQIIQKLYVGDDLVDTKVVTPEGVEVTSGLVDNQKTGSDSTKE